MRSARVWGAVWALCLLCLSAGCNRIFGIEKLHPAADAGVAARGDVDAGVVSPAAGSGGAAALPDEPGDDDAGIPR